MTTPEQLIDRIRIKRLEMSFENKPYDDYEYAESSLRIVLQAVQRGEVVTIDYEKEHDGEIVLKPSFKEFMEGK